MSRLVVLRTPPTARSPADGVADGPQSAGFDARAHPRGRRDVQDGGEGGSDGHFRPTPVPSPQNRRGRHHFRGGAEQIVDAPDDNDSVDAGSDDAPGWFQDLPEWGPAAMSERAVRAACASPRADVGNPDHHLDGDLAADIDAADPDIDAADPDIDAADPDIDAADPDIDAADPDIGAADVDPAPADDTEGRAEASPSPGQASPVAGRRRAVRAPRAARTWGRFAELWIPEPLREARVDPGRRGAWILLLVAAVAAVVTAVGVWRDRPEPVPVAGTSLGSLTAATTSRAVLTEAASTAGEKSPPGGLSASAVPAAPSVADGRTGPIVVSVTGLVAKPGIVTLPVGSRVADAIAAAGGADAQADVTGMNLAARLADGDSVVVGDAPVPQSGPDAAVAGSATGAVTAAATTPPGGPVNLNSADAAALDALPGVGPVMAANILAWRQANGRFTSVEQLQEISGIGPSRFAQISALVTVS